MAYITIVDDDFTLEILADALRNVGHEVRRFASIDDALSDLVALAASQLLILDVMMAPPTSGGNGRNAGMLVYRALRAGNSTMPILVYTASVDADTHAVVDCDSNAHWLSKLSAPPIKEIISRVHALLDEQAHAPLPRAFIVHGHDDVKKFELKNFLQNTLRLPEPIILHEQPSLGRTIIAKFEDYAAESDLAFVLLTPDDIGADATSSDDAKRRARQNVIFELGFFLGTFGRTVGRVFLLYKPPLELPSDLSGICYINISAGIEAAGETIRKELHNVIG